MNGSKCPTEEFALYPGSKGELTKTLEEHDVIQICILEMSARPHRVSPGGQRWVGGGKTGGRATSWEMSEVILMPRAGDWMGQWQEPERRGPRSATDSSYLRLYVDVILISSNFRAQVKIFERILRLPSTFDSSPGHTNRVP